MKYGVIVTAILAILYWLKEIIFQKKIDITDTKVIELTNKINQQEKDLQQQAPVTDNALEAYEKIKSAYDKSNPDSK